MFTTKASSIARAAAMLLAVPLVGCGSPGAAVSTPAATLAPSTLASEIALVDSDVGRGTTVSLIPKGDRVKGQMTMNNCGYTFTTESHRIARLQVEILAPQGQHTGASNEVAVYDTAEQAAKAMNEFRMSVKNCKKTVFHKSGEAGVPKVRYAFETVASAKDLPVKDTAVSTMVVRFKGMKLRMYLELIYQRQGRVISGVYLQQPIKPTKADKAILRIMALATGKRLAAN
ncbi:MAG TPA: hypothetical protein VLL08_15465 [Kineosporiaceae bacterium]|nr:hypothetical protein [Kineosporiaceae bacterium]